MARSRLWIAQLTDAKFDREGGLDGAWPRCRFIDRMQARSFQKVWQDWHPLRSACVPSPRLTCRLSQIRRRHGSCRDA